MYIFTQIHGGQISQIVNFVEWHVTNKTLFNNLLRM